MKRDSSLIDSLGYVLAAKLLGFAFLFITCVIAVPIFLLWDRTKIGALWLVGAFVFVIGLFASFFASKEIVARMADDKSMSFLLAVAHTWYHYLLYLAFIPFIGPVVQRIIDRKKQKNPFVVDDE
jgi:hypothetical protein